MGALLAALIVIIALWLLWPHIVATFTTSPEQSVREAVKAWEAFFSYAMSGWDYYHGRAEFYDAVDALERRISAKKRVAAAVDAVRHHIVARLIPQAFNYFDGYPNPDSPYGDEALRLGRRTQHPSWYTDVTAIRSLAEND